MDVGDGGVYDAGRATAVGMFEQLGIDFSSVAGGVRQDTVAATPRAGARFAQGRPAGHKTQRPRNNDNKSLTSGWRT